MPNRIKCNYCDNMIPISTAQRNAGRCAHCTQYPDWLLQKGAAYRRLRESGDIFSPLPHEKNHILSQTAAFHPNPEHLSISASQAIYRFSTGYHLSLLRNNLYAVLDLISGNFHSYEKGWYAYSMDNLRRQVDGQDHLDQRCPETGDGLHWYPSRFHMPVDTALSIIEQISTVGTTSLAVFLQYEDISHGENGNG